MDNMMDSISELLGSLSAEETQALRETAMSVLGGDAKSSDEIGSEQKSNAVGDMFGGITPDMLEKISSVMSAMNKKDERTQLIAALKPHLSEPRRKKADDAMQLLKLMELIPLLGKH